MSRRWRRRRSSPTARAGPRGLRMTAEPGCRRAGGARRRPARSLHRRGTHPPRGARPLGRLLARRPRRAAQAGRAGARRRHGAGRRRDRAVGPARRPAEGPLRAGRRACTRSRSSTRPRAGRRSCGCAGRARTTSRAISTRTRCTPQPPDGARGRVVAGPAAAARGLACVALLLPPLLLAVAVGWRRLRDGRWPWPAGWSDGAGGACGARCRSRRPPRSCSTAAPCASRRWSGATRGRGRAGRSRRPRAIESAGVRTRALAAVRGDHGRRSLPLRRPRARDAVVLRGRRARAALPRADAR